MARQRRGAEDEGRRRELGSAWVRLSHIEARPG